MKKPFYIYGENPKSNNYTGQLEKINDNVCKGNSLMQNYTNYVDSRLNEIARKSKKICLSHAISLTNRGEICIEYTYSDYSRECKLLMENVRGNWQICRLKFEKTLQKKINLQYALWRRQYV